MTPPDRLPLAESALSREEYAEGRKAYFEAARDVSSRYDQWILTISGGALALSINLVNSTATTPTSALGWRLLGGAWLAFALALLTGLSSLVTNQSALHRVIQEWDARYAGQPANDEAARRYFARLSRWLNWVSFTAVSTGVLLLGGFCGIAVRRVSGG